MPTATTWPTDAEIIGDGSSCRVTRRDCPKGSRFFVFVSDAIEDGQQHACPLLYLPADAGGLPERRRLTEGGAMIHYWQSRR